VIEFASKRAELDHEYEQYRRLETLRHLNEQSPFVGGEGDLDAPIMFVGEAPGMVETEQLRPFVGPAGSLLRNAIYAIGLDSAECWITNMVKYRPPGNRTPEFFEIQASLPLIAKEIEIIDPALVVVLGKVALELIKPGERISAWNGQIIEHEGRLYLPTYHPSAALKFEEYHTAFIDDFISIGSLVRP
jgi:DNA polymerase